MSQSLVKIHFTFNFIFTFTLKYIYSTYSTCNNVRVYIKYQLIINYIANEP